MIADDIDHGGACFFRVMHIGQAITQTRAQVRKGGRWHTGHSSITVCRPCDHTLEQTQYAAHFRIAVQCRHKVHLRRAGVSEANIDTSIHERLHQTLSAAAVVVLAIRLFCVTHLYSPNSNET